MKIKYFGHSCFFICSGSGLTIITDPYSKIVKYPLPEDIKADIVIQSHEHYDHNAANRIKGSPKIVKGSAGYSAESELNFPEFGRTLTFKSMPVHHDADRGRIKGINNIFTWILDGINFCFLGDLGYLLSDEEIRMLGKVDVLFIPVGGLSTLNSEDAKILTGKILPKAVFPMHYKTPVIENLNLAEEDLARFIGKIDYEKQLDREEVEFDKDSLPGETTVFTFKEHAGGSE
ncbi:MAG: MBL fold metallo-hydrolase [Armatimonadota bacterium]